MATIADGIIIGAAGGSIAGLTVWLIQYSHNKITLFLECNRVYKWLNKTTTQNLHEGDQFRSTRAIASWNNLTEDRVRYVCSIEKRIFLSTGVKEDLWSIHEREPHSTLEKYGITQKSDK